MSFEINKSIGAILTGFLVLLLASFITELIYPITSSKDKNPLSYYIEDNSLTNATVADANIISEKKDSSLSKDQIIKALENSISDEGMKFAKKNCASCHSLDDPNKNKIGPSLVGVFGRKSAAVNNYKYSKGLVKFDKVWNEFQLYNFLVKPKEWVPGTKMSYGGIKKDNDRFNVISYLKKLKNASEN